MTTIEQVGVITGHQKPRNVSDHAYTTAIPEGKPEQDWLQSKKQLLQLQVCALLFGITDMCFLAKVNSP